VTIHPGLLNQKYFKNHSDQYEKHPIYVYIYTHARSPILMETVKYLENEAKNNKISNKNCKILF